MGKQFISSKGKPAQEDNIVNIDNVESNFNDRLKRDAKALAALVIQANLHDPNISEPIVVDKLVYKEKIRAEIALNSINDAVICIDINGKIDYLNNAAEKMTGWSRQEANSHPINQIFNIINGSTRKPALNQADFVLQNYKPRDFVTDTILIQRDGAEVAIEHSTSPIYNWDSQLSGVVIVFHDVSETKAMATKMAHLAQYDYLTNLPNRVLFNDRIAQAIAFANRHQTQLAILFLDLDNFKHIND